MHKIKLTEPGFQGGTGQFFGIEFIDGVSVEPVPVFVSNRIGSILSIHLLDEEGNELHQAGPGYELAASRERPSEVAPPPILVEDGVEDAPPPVLYTETILSDIASSEGIAGLRPIGEKFGVRSTSISGLIAAILKAQASA